MNDILERISDFKIKFKNTDIPVNLYATEEVDIDSSSVKEACELEQKLSNVNKGNILKISISPDFHKGKGIPIGTSIFTENLLIPESVGKDVGCGICLFKTDLKKDEIFKDKKKLKEVFRNVFFEGGRNIKTSSELRKNILEKGNRIFSENKSLFFKNTLFNFLPEKTDNIFKFSLLGNSEWQKEWVNENSLYDTQLGSIGGGNHFVEIQTDSENNIYIMSHTGSVSLGTSVWNEIEFKMEKFFKGQIKPPIYTLKADSELGYEYISMLNSGINFASVNRILLVLMVLKSFSEYLNKKVNGKFIWDLPHNWIEKKDNNYIHRKGSCPAYLNDPVLIPGSMGSSSFVLNGLGNEEALFSGPHGAGRKIKRKNSKKQDLSELFVITKINEDILLRKDIKNIYLKNLSEESPENYKNILPVIETVEKAGIAEIKKKLEPLFTLKGL